MSVVWITTSPKKHHRLANSTYAARLTEWGCGKGTRFRLQGPKDYASIEAACAKAEAVVLAMPLFVDSIPAHVLAFLQAMEEPTKAWKVKLYVVSCCGFFEGRQTQLQMDQIKCWCRRTGVEYGGGLGIGGTEMLGAIRFTNLLACIPMGLLAGGITGLCSGNLHAAAISGGTTFGVSLALFLLWSSGLLYHTLRFGRMIRKGKTVPDRFTTVWFCGRPLFTFFASLFWILRAMKNRVSFRKMGKQIRI